MFPDISKVIIEFFGNGSRICNCSVINCNRSWIIETAFIGQKGTQYIPGFFWIIKVFLELILVIGESADP